MCHEATQELLDHPGITEPPDETEAQRERTENPTVALLTIEDSREGLAKDRLSEYQNNFEPWVILTLLALGSGGS